MMTAENDDSRIVTSADVHTPQAGAIRFTGMHAGILCIELFDDQGNAIAVALVEAPKVAMIDEAWRMAVSMARSTAEPGLGSMLPEGRA